MSGTFVADPKYTTNDRIAGVNSVKSNGTVALRAEPGLFVAQQNSDKATYVVNFNVAATAAIDVLTFGAAGAGKVHRLRRIVLVNPGSATAVAVVDFALGTAAAAGSGGSAITAQPVDSGVRSAGVTGGPDAAYGGTARHGDTTQASGFVGVYSALASVSVPATAGAFTPLAIYDDRDDGKTKSLTVTGAGGNGFINLRVGSAGAGATGMRGYAEFSLEDA